jgi:hypothetical protein
MAAVADVPLYDPEADVFKNPSKWRRRSCSTLRGTTQASNWDRLGRIGTFERALAEGAPCRELLDFLPWGVERSIERVQGGPRGGRAPGDTRGSAAAVRANGPADCRPPEGLVVR